MMNRAIQHSLAIGLVLLSGMSGRTLAQQKTGMNGAIVTAAPSGEMLFEGAVFGIAGAAASRS